MANGSGGNNGYMADETRISFGAVNQKVLGLESAITNLNAQLAHVANRVDNAISALSQKIDERARPQYTLLVSMGIFGLSVLSGVGYLAVSPMRDSLIELKQIAADTTKALIAMPDKFITIREITARSDRNLADMARINSDINALQLNIVPRSELQERQRTQEAQTLNVQRQLDDQKKVFGDTYSLRDALQQMTRRLDLIEGKGKS